MKNKLSTEKYKYIEKEARRVARISQRGGVKFDSTVNELDPNFY